MSSVLDDIGNEFGPKLLRIERKNPRRVYVKLADADLTPVAKRLFDRGGRLATITGIDTRNGIELLYHFFFADEHLMITLKTLLPKPLPRATSLAPWLPAANWAEREIRDLLGATFEGHPDPRRLLLEEACWPEGAHPLRRDFKGHPDENRDSAAGTVPPAS